MTIENNSDSDQVILATGGYDHTIKLWHTHKGICLRAMQHAESQVNALEITQTDNYLPQLVINNISNVTSIGFQEDGKWMYSGGEDGRVRIWDLRSTSLQCPKSFEGLAPVTCVRLHPNQENYLLATKGNIYRWEIRTDNNEQLVSLKGFYDINDSGGNLDSRW
ncbi:g beta-like protein gbl [Holotrichia oblita]|uniref:G beta-like protein gbl n=1 Tax=Holotrichia oblita TaxID=644536 RepID=A0ACB9T5V0_HOLOL|nr:g beta-like protein gbl [Holotrichia oblita]